MKNIINPAYLVANLSRANRWHNGSIDEWSPADWMTACVGELGELANVMKKIKRHEDGIAGNTANIEELHEWALIEWVDTLAYLTLLAQRMGWEADDIDRAVTEKFNLVSAGAGFPERI